MKVCYYPSYVMILLDLTQNIPCDCEFKPTIFKRVLFDLGPVLPPRSLIGNGGDALTGEFLHRRVTAVREKGV